MPLPGVGHEHDEPPAASARHLTGRSAVPQAEFEYADKPYFLEFNPRATQIVHLGALFGVDLCGALSCVLNGVPVPKPKHLSALSVALFPQDWRRDPSGRDRPADVLDIPMRDPKLFRALSSFLPQGAVVPDLNKPPSFRP